MRRLQFSKGMNADKLSTAEDWSIAKRVHVGRLVESNNDGTSDIRALKSRKRYTGNPDVETLIVESSFGLPNKHMMLAPVDSVRP